MFAICHLATLLHCVCVKALKILKRHCSRDAKAGVGYGLPCLPAVFSTSRVVSFLPNTASAKMVEDKT